jgi:hypothetical protein
MDVGVFDVLLVKLQLRHTEPAKDHEWWDCSDHEAELPGKVKANSGWDSHTEYGFDDDACSLGGQAVKCCNVLLDDVC